MKCPNTHDAIAARRRLLKVIPAVSAGGAGAVWMKPAISSVMLPAHAAASSVSKEAPVSPAAATTAAPAVPINTATTAAPAVIINTATATTTTAAPAAIINTVTSTTTTAAPAVTISTAATGPSTVITTTPPRRNYTALASADGVGYKFRVEENAARDRTFAVRASARVTRLLTRTARFTHPSVPVGREQALMLDADAGGGRCTADTMRVSLMLDGDRPQIHCAFSGASAPVIANLGLTNRLLQLDEPDCPLLSSPAYSATVTVYNRPQSDAGMRGVKRVIDFPLLEGAPVTGPGKLKISNFTGDIRAYI